VIKTLVFKTPPIERLRQTVPCLIDEIIVRMKQSVTIIHLESLKCFRVCPEESSYLKTLHVLHCERTFRGREGNTILKNVIKDWSFSGSCEECDAVFLNKNVYEFYFLLVSFGWE